MPESYTGWMKKTGGEYGKLSNPKETIQVLQKHEFQFKKKFGQNFLIDPHVLDKIVDAAQITKDDFVLEIGPGIGTLTQYLCENARQVLAVEIDDKLIPILKETLQPYDNVEVLHGDILKQDIQQIADTYNDGKPIKVVANLPYYITTPIIMELFESHVPLANVTVMVQKEVADRMKAEPGTKDYGALSLAVQYYAKPYSPPLCHRTVLCRGQMSAVRSYDSTVLQEFRSKCTMKN